MRSVTLIILLAFITQAFAKEAEKDFMDNFVDKLVDKLFARLSTLSSVSRPAFLVRQQRFPAPAVKAYGVEQQLAKAKADPDETTVLNSQSAADSVGAASRRQALLSGALAFSGAVLPAMPAFAGAEDSKTVGSFLPESKVEPGLYEFASGAQRTPALRAGTLSPYTFALPGDWKQLPVSNAISGNYCQPRCDEATTELKFGEPKEGNAQIIIIPTKKTAVRINNPKIEDFGSTNRVMDLIGPAITGSIPVDPTEIVSAESAEHDGKTYYTYELDTPDAIYGVHNVAAVTTDQNYVIVAAIAANDKQWGAAREKLLGIARSFRVG